MRTIRYEIDEAHDGMQVGSYLQGKGCSRAILTLLKKTDGLHLNGTHIRTVDKVGVGDVLTLSFSDRSDIAPNASLEAGIVYDDDDVVVFAKPPSMPCHTSIWHGHDTLANLFSALYPDCYYHSVGRLDKDTSGLVVVAKNKFAAAKMMSEGKYRPQKRYYAVTSCRITECFGICGDIIAPIARGKADHAKRVISAEGEYAHTRFRVIAQNDRYCLHEVTIFTGRTHQIRVHFAHAGFPLAGDKLYGGKTEMINRQALHCGMISFVHPVTDEPISLNAPLPDDMAVLIYT